MRYHFTLVIIGIIKKTWNKFCEDVEISGRCFLLTSLVGQLVKNLPAVQEIPVQSLGLEDPLEKEMATHSSILAWKISWIEEPGGLQSMGLHKELGTTGWLTLTYLLFPVDGYGNCCSHYGKEYHFSHLVNSSTPRTTARQASLSITNSRSSLKLMSIQPSHPLSSPSPPAPSPSQHQGLFQWVNSSHEMAKVLEFQLQHQSFQWTPRTDLL